jgi:hypothetical protein
MSHAVAKQGGLARTLQVPVSEASTECLVLHMAQHSVALRIPLMQDRWV